MYKGGQVDSWWTGQWTDWRLTYKGAQVTCSSGQIGGGCGQVSNGQRGGRHSNVGSRKVGDR